MSWKKQNQTNKVTNYLTNHLIATTQITSSKLKLAQLKHIFVLDFFLFLLPRKISYINTFLFIVFFLQIQWFIYILFILLSFASLFNGIHIIILTFPFHPLFY